MTKNEFQLLYSIKKNGVRSYRKMHESTGLSLGLISKLMASFAAAGALALLFCMVGLAWF